MNPWLVAIFYMFIGTFQLLVTKYSERGGKLVYNTAWVVFLIEFIKCFIAFGIHGFLTWRAGAKKQSKSGKTPFWKSAVSIRYAAPAALYAIQNNLNIVSISMLEPHVFQLLNNLKIVSAASFSRLLLGKSFSIRQYGGMLVLVISCCVSRWDFVISIWNDLSSYSAHNTSKKNATFMLGFLLAVISIITSGAAGVVNEKVLKFGDNDLSGWQKNGCMYMWGALLNLVSLIINAVAKAFTGLSYTGFIRVSMENLASSLDDTSAMAQILRSLTSVMDQSVGTPSGFNIIAFWFGLWDGFTIQVCIVIAANVLLGLSISLVLQHLSNMVKAFAGPLILLLTTISSWYLLDAQLTVYFIYAMVIYSVSVWLYVGGVSAASPKKAGPKKKTS